MIILTDEQKAIFKQWIIENIDETIVPGDEGNGDALIFNLIHRIDGDNEIFRYGRRQEEELDQIHDKRVEAHFGMRFGP